MFVYIIDHYRDKRNENKNITKSDTEIKEDKK